MTGQQEDIESLRKLLAELVSEHRELDTAIDELQNNQSADQLELTRLKKKKLQLKDRIITLENKLLPDIIA